MAILAMLALSFAPGSEKGSTGENSQDAVMRGSAELLNAGLAILLTILGTTSLFHSNIGIPGLRPESLSLLVLWIVGTRILYKRQKL
jgi:hypothetical protein